MTYPVSYGSAVPDRHPTAVEEVEPPKAAEEPAAGARRPPYQRTLFPTGRVVAFEQYSTPAGRSPRVRARAQESGTRSGVAIVQQSFDWSGEWPGSANRRRQATQEALRYCNAPVAAPMHRAAAAALDVTLVALGVGLVLMVVYMSLGAELVNLKTLPYFGCLALAFGVAYKLLWAVAGVDSPGLRWTQLRTLNFDGLEPTSRERLLRVATGCFSVLSGGLGLMWSLADEETLTWHDHMSKTFLTAFPGE